MTGKLFISYRRDDSAGHAGRLRDRLEREFGRDLLFMDVDAIPLGMNFIKVLRDEVSKCDVLLAIIGPNWSAIRDKEGKRRLDDKNDFVRIEVGTALTRDIPVIPVLLDGAELPKPEELPPDLEELAVRNGIFVRHASFHGDMDRLIAGLLTSLGKGETLTASSASAPIVRAAVQDASIPAQRAGRRRWPILMFGSAMVLAAAVVAAIIFKKPPASTPPIPPLPIATATPPQPLPAPVASAPIPSPAAAPQSTPRAEIPPTPPTPAAPVQPPTATPTVAAPPKPVLAPVPPAQSLPAETEHATPHPEAAAPAAELTPASPVQAEPKPAPEKKAEPPAATVAKHEPAHKPGESFKDCENCPELVVLPAGSFVMGSPDGEQGRSADESPQHVVTIAKPIAVGKFEITVDQFAAFINETKYDAGDKCLTLEDGKSSLKDGRSWRDPGYPQTGSHPVACVSWSDAKAYAIWLSRKTGKDYRLLSEGEWEYAARATTTRGSGSRYSFGDDDGAMCRYANVADRTARQTIPGASSWTVFPCSDGYAYAAPVGLFTANAFGLYDLLGNVWEWTQDCYNATYNGAPADGTAWTAGDCAQRVIRGGMWGSSPASVRSARRFKDQATTRSQDIGFRIAHPIEQ
ncbi:MAG TPA: SUMF1/EgtB/PvdO family nonheme iron enzyme [Xanthobacteraceae bacterium]|jgi:formylglycine-generating enzyme required for sulfatase activity|nr:SUMF1/EgtB/PvdO family nonheme iron enzyme [Xanthobacteraceae bacterium]